MGSTSKSARPRVCLERESHSRQKKERERERRNARVTIYPLLQAGGSRIVKGPDREKASWRKLLRLVRERERRRALIGRRPFKAAEASPDLASADRMTRQVRIGGTSKRRRSLSLSAFILCSLAHTHARARTLVAADDVQLTRAKEQFLPGLVFFFPLRADGFYDGSETMSESLPFSLVVLLFLRSIMESERMPD